ncbi:MAG: type II toxin-antitoxin system prevent-host-death family antitoxin [Candidatus Sumerlaeota bacterium]|nr:type II toxin-antitoxin system prevent-host-death family antitoxin [Candidatus Sumerlaeota bacterium]
MTRRSTTALRRETGDLLDRVTRKNERFVLSRRQKDVAVLISIEDAALLERLSKEEEDRLDRQAIKEARKEPGLIPWKKIKKNLGLC